MLRGVAQKREQCGIARSPDIFRSGLSQGHTTSECGTRLPGGRACEGLVAGAVKLGALRNSASVRYAIDRRRSGKVSDSP